MAQDIRDMFKKEGAWESGKLPEGHQMRFEARLDKALPEEPANKTNNNFFIVKIAAVMLVVFGIGIFMLNPENPYQANPVADTPQETDLGGEQEATKNTFQLSEVSPQFKKIENYYLANLNVELAKLDVNEDNKALIDAFMAQLAELDKEYQRLNAEFDEGGANEQTVEAMIANLQLRIELLYKLKSKLKEINQSNKNSYENLQA